MTLSRRELFSRGGTAGVAVAVAGSAEALFTAEAAAAVPVPRSGYGELVPDQDGLLDLPRGFRYEVLSREGGPLTHGDGVVPSRFDGMGYFPAGAHRTRLVRNHEIRSSARHVVVAPPSHTYDPGGKAGTSTLVLSPSHRVQEEYVSLAGTAVNCAGGITPWHTWLTCEETEDRRGDANYEKDHGFIFEVDPYDQGRNVDPTPLTAMGRYQHEAICIDPGTGVVYETEDAFSYPFGCYYRFLPERPLGGYGSLRAGGLLQAMRVPGVSDLSTVQTPGATFDGIEWVDVPDPLATTVPIRDQDFGPEGVTHAQKLEGAWWGNGSAYFVSSFGRTSQGSGGEHDGQVWRYDPVRNRLTLEVVFNRSTNDLYSAPDNMCMSPFGGLMLAEDGAGENYLLGVTAGGEPYLFARNRQNIGTPEDPRFGEFAGVVFSADGQTLFVNCYNPGTTFAITGPWMS